MYCSGIIRDESGMSRSNDFARRIQGVKGNSGRDREKELFARRVKSSGIYRGSRILLRSTSRSGIARARHCAHWHHCNRRHWTGSLQHSDAAVPSRSQEDLVRRAHLHRARRTRSSYFHTVWCIHQGNT